MYHLHRYYMCKNNESHKTEELFHSSSPEQLYQQSPSPFSSKKQEAKVKKETVYTFQKLRFYAI